jgi:hypothetical protein
VCAASTIDLASACVVAACVLAYACCASIRFLSYRLPLFGELGKNTVFIYGWRKITLTFSIITMKNNEANYSCEMDGTKGESWVFIFIIFFANLEKSRKSYIFAYILCFKK